MQIQPIDATGYAVQQGPPRRPGSKLFRVALPLEVNRDVTGPGSEIEDRRREFAAKFRALLRVINTVDAMGSGR